MGLAWYAERGPGDCMGPADNSVAIAAEAESLVRDIDEAMASLIAAKRAAENEDNVEARTLMGNARFILDVALMPDMED